MNHLHLIEEELQQAAEIIISYKMASVSLLQRRMDIPYNKSAELMEGLEAAEIVGPFEGKQMRKLLVSNPTEARSRIKNLLKK
jgi:S-DNA-T family DNA segregation ATPase FtsK/SpoIIIE